MSSSNKSSPAPGPPGRQSNLPYSLTGFIGREKEITQAAKLLDSGRLLTLTGPGGVGKTRLALLLAHSRQTAFKDGVRLIELAGLFDPSMVPAALVHSLGLQPNPGRSPEQTLQHYLQDREMLLCLDNCEHLLEAAAAMAVTLLENCPRLKILATSREALGVLGEITFAVPPLELPAAIAKTDRELSPEALLALEQTESVRLFIQRVSHPRPEFALTAANAAAVTTICRSLGRLTAGPRTGRRQGRAVVGRAIG